MNARYHEVKTANVSYSCHRLCNRVKAGTPAKGRRLHGWVVDREHALQSLLKETIVCAGQQILIIMTCYVKTPLYVIKTVVHTKFTKAYDIFKPNLNVSYPSLLSSLSHSFSFLKSSSSE